MPDSVCKWMCQCAWGGDSDTVIQQSHSRPTCTPALWLSRRRLSRYHHMWESNLDGARSEYLPGGPRNYSYATEATVYKPTVKSMAGGTSVVRERRYIHWMSALISNTYYRQMWALGWRRYLYNEHLLNISSVYTLIQRYDRYTVTS